MAKEERILPKAALTDAEKKEFNKLRKKLNHYWNAILIPFDKSLVGIHHFEKLAALEDFLVKQDDYRPTDEEMDKLKLLFHKDRQFDPLFPRDLLAIEEIEAQILNILRSAS